MSLTDFLKAHYKTKKDTDLISTHTRIPNKENNIKGGNYCIEFDELPKFYELLYNETIVGEKLEYLTEAQCSTCGPVYIDLDFHYDKAVLDRKHDQDWVEDFIHIYLRTVEKYYIVNEPINAYVMQRDGVNRLPEKTKDGIHILFDFQMDRRIQKQVREDFLQNKSDIFKQLPLINSPQGVFDEGINNGTTNLTVYGCRKPLHEAYKLVRIVNFELDPRDNEYSINDKEIHMNQELYNCLSVNLLQTTKFEYTELSNDILNPVEKAERELQKQKYIDATGEEKNTVENLEKLFRCFTDKRINEYESWSKLAWATYNALGKEGKAVLIKANERLPHRNTISEKMNVEEFYDNITEQENGVSWGSLHMWAKEDNAKLYSELFPKITKNEKTADIQQLFRNCESGNSVDLAKYFIGLYGENYKCVDIKNKSYYNFVNKLWVQDQGGASIRLLLSDECVKEFQKRKIEIEKLLKMGELNSSVFNRLRLSRNHARPSTQYIPSVPKMTPMNGNQW